MDREQMTKDAEKYAEDNGCPTCYINHRVMAEFAIDVNKEVVAEAVKAERKRIAGILKHCVDNNEFVGTWFEVKVVQVMQELEVMNERYRKDDSRATDNL